MPDDRFIHRRLGHSDKISQLSDFEFRVWAQYLLSADDFGVMRSGAATFQADNDALAEKPASSIQKAIGRLVRIDLLQTFDHQGRPYLYQWDWQDWQRVGYPRATLHPAAPFDRLSSKTRDLFGKHPGGWGRKVPQPLENGSANGSRTEQEPFTERLEEISPKPLAVSREPLALAVSRGPVTHPAERHGLQTLHRRGHQSHAFCSERICVPDFQHEKFARALGGGVADGALKAFYAETVESIPFDQPIEPDPLKFWPPYVTARWPPQTAQVSKQSAALARASAGFLASFTEAK